MEPALVLAALTGAVVLVFAAWALRARLASLEASRRRVALTPKRSVTEEERRRMEELALERELFGRETAEEREASVWRAGR